MKPIMISSGFFCFLMLFFNPGDCFCQEASVSEAFANHVLSPEMEQRYDATVGYHALTPEGQKDLGLTAQQVLAIESAGNSYDAERKKLTAELNNNSFDNYNEYQTSEDKAREQCVAEILAVYTTEQRNRLAQIIFQKHISRRGNDVGMYLHPDLSPFLKLTPDQVTNLGETVGKQNDKYLNELAELYEKHHQKLLDRLPEELRDKASEIVGEPYLPFRPEGTSVLEEDK